MGQKERKIMAKTKHTPGPWEVHHRENGCLITANYGEIGIARTANDVFLTPAEQKANARLIALVPELLAALKDAHAALKNHPNGDNRSEHDSLACDLLLAKAEGKE